MNHETVVSESAVSGFMFTHCVLLRTVIIGLLLLEYDHTPIWNFSHLNEQVRNFRILQYNYLLLNK